MQQVLYSMVKEDLIIIVAVSGAATRKKAITRSTRMYNTDALLSALNKYAKWDTLPQELQSSAIAAWQQAKPASSTTQEAAAEQAQENFLRALVSTVPQEWIVTQYNAFKPGSQLQATMHAQAVGTPYGLMCFGGMQCGKLAQLKVKSEVSWIKEDNGYMLQPDLSTVYQVGM